MRKKLLTKETQKTNFFETTQRCMNIIAARRRLDLPIGGTIQSLQRLLNIDIDMAELRTDDYICAVMINGVLSNRVPRRLEEDDIAEEMRPVNYLGHKEHITFYHESFIADGNIMIFTDERIVTAKWKNR